MKKGFTLVELAIVIVIVGLIVGGVLQGQELMKQARVRSQIKQFEGYAAALATFELKYNQLPGDMKYSLCMACGFTCTSTANIHIGNGQINDRNNANPPTTLWGDIHFVFVHLSEAKLIKTDHNSIGGYSFADGGKYVKSEIGSGGFAMLSYNNKINLFSLSSSVASAVAGDDSVVNRSESGSFTPEEAWQIDSKWDDGIPNKGLVRPVNTDFTNDTTASSCVTTTAADYYNLTNSNTVCRLLIQVF